MKKQFSIFLDRDGIINQQIEGDYVKSIPEFKFRPDFLKEIQYLSKSTNYIVVVTNQQGIGKKQMTEETLHKIHDYMLSITNDLGGRIDAVYYCPHLKEQNCNCRKPKTGMIDQAILDFPSIKQDIIIMIGDSPSDIEAAKSAGLISVGMIKYRDDNRFQEVNPDYIIESLSQLRTEVLPAILKNKLNS